MTAIVSDRTRIHQARRFLSNLSGGSADVLYLTIGKTTPWTNEPSPSNPTDTVEERDYQYWKDMFGAKRILPEDVALCIPRYNWITSTIYAQYQSDDAALFTKQFYVVTDIGDGTFNIYLCLNNYNGSPSTVKPTGTSTTAFQTADKYIWKYMYKVSAIEAGKFMTADFIYISDSATPASPISGGILTVKVTNPGSGYVTAPSVTITGNGVSPTAHAVLNGSQVAQIIIDSPGSGNTSATVSITGGSGTGAIGKAEIPPVGGHGASMVDELGALYAMFSMSLVGSETGSLTVSNDYRNIGVLANATLFGSSTQATALNVRQTYKHPLTSITGVFQNDETITGGTTGTTATVVEYDATNHLLYVNNVSGSGFSTETVTGGTSTAAATIGIGAGYQAPALQPYSGNFFFLENRFPIYRNADQTETIKDVIEF